MSKIFVFFILLSSFVAASFSIVPTSNRANGAETLPKLKVSDNRRFLVQENGAPFFWLGDTAWELFHRLNRNEALEYLDWRQKQGFTVVQAVAVAELGGPDVPNANGYLPFKKRDGEEVAPIPAVKDGPNNDFWDDVDFVVDEANKRGLYIGFLPTWGAYWKERPIFNSQNAEEYGEWLGRRYRDKGLVWILGGDRTIDDEKEREVLIAMARGLRRGDGGAHLITFHPRGGGGSSEYFQNEVWLDFNMRQNGHGLEYGAYDKTRDDYERTPIKPVLDGEPVYEDHPINFNPDQFGHSIAADVRRPLYWDLFNGAFGHTYGNHSVWQMFDPEKTNDSGVNRPLLSWRRALDRPGANQMRFAKKLIESRPFLTRIPDASIVVDADVSSSIPGAGTRRFVATRDESGTFAFVYVPVGREFSVRTNVVKSKTIRAYWFDPRTGRSTKIGDFANDVAERRFIPPTLGEALDWVLVLDDPTKYPNPPGATKYQQ